MHAQNYQNKTKVDSKERDVQEESRDTTYRSCLGLSILLPGFRSPTSSQNYLVWKSLWWSVERKQEYTGSRESDVSGCIQKERQGVWLNKHSCAIRRNTIPLYYYNTRNHKQMHIGLNSQTQTHT